MDALLRASAAAWNVCMYSLRALKNYVEHYGIAAPVEIEIYTEKSGHSDD